MIVIRAQRYRTQERNRQDAIERFQGILSKELIEQKMRKVTKPPKSASAKRLEEKAKRGELKASRKPVSDD